MKILFLINCLGGGGAERVLVNLVNNMDIHKYDITVQTIFRAGINKQHLKDHIKIIESGWKSFKGISILFKLIPAKILYNLLVKNPDYDLMVAYMHGPPTKILWGCPDKNVKKIAWLHTDMKRSSIGRTFFSKKQITRAFGSYDKIAGVSETVSRSFRNLYGLNEKVATTYNTYDIVKINHLSGEATEDNWFENNLLMIVSAGRLSEEKGYERLLKVSRKLLEEGFRFNLLIMGGGSAKASLQQYIDSHGLSNNIKLSGFMQNPYPYIKKADIFVCSSRTEGLSTVVSEAIILGTPVVSTLVSGAEEVLGRNGEYGIITENSENGLYEGMKYLLSNPEKISFYREKARERAAFFDTKRSVKEVEKMFEEVLNCKNH